MAPRKARSTLPPTDPRYILTEDDSSTASPGGNTPGGKAQDAIRAQRNQAASTSAAVNEAAESSPTIRRQSDRAGRGTKRSSYADELVERPTKRARISRDAQKVLTDEDPAPQDDEAPRDANEDFNIFADDDDSDLSEHDDAEFEDVDVERLGARFNNDEGELAEDKVMRSSLLRNIPDPDEEEPSTPLPKKRGRPRKANAPSGPPSPQASRRRNANTNRRRLPTTDPADAPADPAADFTASLLSQVDPKLVALSRKLEFRKPLGEKPAPKGKPEVWAASRQALAETLPYFKSPQSGCYSNDGHVYGFLFDSVGHCREYMDPDLIICRAGGGMGKDADGNMVQRQHHDMSEAQPNAINNDIYHKNPLIVICGDRNVKAVNKMPHKYCVLDWFKPVAMWSEKTAGKGGRRYNTIKYRFERLNSDRKPAWNATGDEYSLTEEEQALVGDLRRSTCSTCENEYSQVYLLGWMCLNADCDAFWKVNGQDVEAGSLLYNPAFLLDRNPRWAADGEAEMQPALLRPPPPAFGEALGENLSYINTRGICCPLCWRCNSRRLFTGWVCETPGCGYTLCPSRKPVVPAMLHTPWDAAPTLVRNGFDADEGVKIQVWNQSGYKICKYTFEGVKGCLIHAAASLAICKEAGGADDILANLQVEDIGLERHTFVNRKTPTANEDTSVHEPVEVTALPTPPVDADNETYEPEPEPKLEEPKAAKNEAKFDFEEGNLMTAFSMNYGMPYKFVASGRSRPFTGAPSGVVNARARLNWAARAFLNDPAGDQDFNEQLVIGYLEGQKIGFHDDGEYGLGPRIASISLGARAEMMLRVKRKHYFGCSNAGLLTEEEPIPCSIDGDEMYQKRKLAWEELQPLKNSASAADRVAYNKRRKEIPRELGLVGKQSRKNSPVLVTLSLSHGDIVVMDGHDIQKYMEHGVESKGYLRFAMTCRSVLEGHLKPEERPTYEVLEETPEERYNGPSI